MLSYIWFWKINSKGVVFNMEPFKNFKVAAYVYAYYLEKVDEAEIQRGIDYFKKYIHLDKVYIENHRGTVDIPVEKLKAVKALFEKNGIETSGGITSGCFSETTQRPPVAVAEGQTHHQIVLNFDAATVWGEHAGNEFTPVHVWQPAILYLGRPTQV